MTRYRITGTLSVDLETTLEATSKADAFARAFGGANGGTLHFSATTLNRIAFGPNDPAVHFTVDSLQDVDVHEIVDARPGLRKAGR